MISQTTGLIYCFTNKINGKKYIGQTITGDQRRMAHISSAYNKKAKDHDSLFHRAIRKYGIENFHYEILEDNIPAPFELNDKEIAYINQFNSLVPNGYNVSIGGGSGAYPMLQESKEKLMKTRMLMTEEEVIALRLAYAAGESPTKIYKEKYADKMHYNSFLNIWSGRRCKHIMPEVIQNGRHTKLNEEIVKQIKILRANGKSYDYISASLNISKSTVADICKERTWKHVQIEPVSTIPFAFWAGKQGCY